MRLRQIAQMLQPGTWNGQASDTIQGQFRGYISRGGNGSGIYGPGTKETAVAVEAAEHLGSGAAERLATWILPEV